MTHRNRDAVVKSAELAMEAGRIAARDKRHGDSAALFQEAAETYEQAKDDEGNLKAKSLLARQLALTPGSVQRALKIAEDCQTQCKSKSSSGIFLGAVYNAIGLAYMDCRAYPSATAAFLLALPYYKETNWTMEATINQNLGCAYYCRSDFENARRFHQTSTDIYLEHENEARAAQGFVNVALCYAKMKRHDMARAAYEKSLSAAHRCGSRTEEWQALQGLATSYSAEGQLEKAVQYYKQAFVACSLPSDAGDLVNDYVKDRLFKSLSQAILRCHTQTIIKRDTTEEDGGDGGGGDAEVLEVRTVSDHHNTHSSLVKTSGDNSTDGSITEVTENDAQNESSVSDVTNSDEEGDAKVLTEEMRRLSEGAEHLDNTYTPFERTERGVQSPLPEDPLHNMHSAESPARMDSDDIGSKAGSSDSDTDESSGETLSDMDEQEGSKQEPKKSAAKSALTETYVDPVSNQLNYFRYSSLTTSKGLDNTYMTIDHPLITKEVNDNMPSTSADAKSRDTLTNSVSSGRDEEAAAKATQDQALSTRQKSRACILL